MEQIKKERFEARARILKALAHPTRLFIVDQLEQQEHSVSELTSMVGVDVSTMSKHLSQLKQVGIIRDEKRGNQVFYSLAVPCVMNFFDCVEAVIEEQHTRYLHVLGSGRD
nr:metalloregulator ArsR/SmtB family transcription factor [uncultured Desulfuromonas sp.]